MSETRLHFLGPAQFVRAGIAVELNIAKLQALFAYLAVSGTPQRREHLLDLLWSESHPDAARKNLRNRLWRARRALGEGILIAEGNTVALSASVWTDVAAFESGLKAQADEAKLADSRLTSFLDLWRGPLLDGLTLPDAPNFELWLSRERERLGLIYQGGLQKLIGQHRARSEWRELIAVAHRALEHDETQEPIHAQIMDAYTRLGLRADALRQYEMLRAILERDLSVAPMPETEALRAQILGDDLLLETPPFPAPLGVQPAPQVRTSRDRPFVGRQVECNALSDALQLAGSGHFQIVLISGELGIGKSYLWQQWSARLPEHTIVLEARCLDATQTLPFAPLTELFGAPGNLERMFGPQAPVSPIWLTELARLMPQIRDRRPDLPDAIPLPAQEERRRIFEAFVQTLRAMAATPLVLFIDDLHWADRATLDWLAYLTDRMRGESLLLVGAYRTDEASPEIVQFSAQLSRERFMTRLSLSPLTLDESAKLLRELAGDSESVAYLHLQSGGNPYFLTELSQAHPEATPVGLGELVSARVRSLPERAQRLLQIAAILEPTISYSTLREISTEDEEATLDALDNLLDKTILTERDDAYEFAHPLLARIVRDGLSGARRRSLHRRVAEYLKALHESELTTVAGQLALHYAEADEKAKAATYAEMAAERSTEMGAMAEAAHSYRQAHTLAPSTGRLLKVGYALMQLPGLQQEARDAMQQALTEYADQQDQKGIVQAGLRLAVSYLSLEEGEKVLYWANTIHTYLGDARDMALRATVQYLLASGKFHADGGMVEADKHFKEATRLATEHDLASDIAVQSWFGWANLSVQCGEFFQAQAKFKQAMEIAKSTRNIYFEALCYNNLAYATLLADDLPGARTAIDRGLEFVARHELMRPRQYQYSTRGEIALAEGDPDAAESWFLQAMEEARLFDNVTQVNNIQAHLGLTAQARGNLEQAKVLLSSAYHALPATGARHLRIQLELWLAELFVLRNDQVEARKFLALARAKLADGHRKALIASAHDIARRLNKTESPI